MNKRYILALLFLVFIVTAKIPYVYAEQVSPPGLGFGVCHWAGTYGMARSDTTINWFYSGGGGEDWIQIEPQRSVYNFAPLDAQYDRQFKSKPNTYFWLNILTAQPVTIPEWAKKDPSLGYIVLSSSGKLSTFPIWKKEYQEVFESLLTKTSEHIYSSSFKYRNNLKAIIMMSGGPFGEMITYSGCPDDEKCKKYLAAGYSDDIYFDAMVNWLTPLYIRLFPDYPIVLQLGGGIYGNGIGYKIAKALVDKYGSRMYLKWNGWDRKFAQEPNSTDRAYHKFMNSVADKSRVGFEPGWAWAIPDSETDEMRQSIYDSLMKTLEDVPVSYFCLQDKYYKILTDAQLQELSLRMRGIHSVYPTFPPLPSSTPKVTPTPTMQPAHPDVENDGKVTALDYFYVLLNKMGGVTPLTLNADVNRDGKVDSLDLEIIITEILK